jgi:hypothetical protein
MVFTVRHRHAIVLVDNSILALVVELHDVHLVSEKFYVTGASGEIPG